MALEIAASGEQGVAAGAFLPSEHTLFGGVPRYLALPENSAPEVGALHNAGAMEVPHL